MNIMDISKSLFASDEWRSMYPGAAAGFVAVGNIENTSQHLDLEKRKIALEAELRSRYIGQDRNSLESMPVMQAYEAYYRKFKKTYHVLLQLESVAFKGKSIPSVSVLVTCMFMAELKNGLLTAGHDLDVVQLPVQVNTAGGEERYTLLRGQESSLKPGDMYMADRQGIISSVIYGPDQRTQITGSTHRALFAVYAPPGIGREAVEGHLNDILMNIKAVCPDKQVEALKVIEAL